MNSSFIDTITFDEKGLVPAVVQDVETKEVLMLAYMNKDALKQTIATRKATYFSRSRQQLWEKGETSGNTQKVVGLSYDCDADTILLQVEQTGVACHTGEQQCFFNNVIAAPKKEDIILELYSLIETQKEQQEDGSYTGYLFKSGIDKILKKVGEETSEVIIAAKNNDKNELINETSDLVYHLLVLLAKANISPTAIKSELAKRRKG
jgi:phosphoribosyl-AMP cyclohydrolase / phosphoribosyl-ATP pyrophosphohydrolase